MENDRETKTANDLLARARRGELEAFEELLFLYEKKIFNYIFRLCQNREDAQDLTQDTFIKLHKNLKKIDPAKNFKSWLYTIATNTAYDHLRKKTKLQEDFWAEEEDFESETIGQDSTYKEVERDYDIEQALSKIRPIYRSVLLLFYFQGFSYEEIADILGRPINTVKTLLRRSKAELKNNI